MLGITHHGSRLENDAYFNNVVISAFRLADVMHFEDGGSAAGNQQVECQTPISDPTGVQTLQRAREIIQKGAVEYFRAISKDLPGGPPAEVVLKDNARIFAEGLSEFSVVSTLKIQYEFLKPQARLDVSAAGNGPVVQRLRKIRPRLPIQSLDEADDLARAYCSSAVRLQILKAHIESYNPDFPLPQASAAEAVRQIDEQAHDLFVEHRSTPGPVNDAFVCPRNELWLERIPAMNDGKVHFLAVGAAHLFPYRGASKQCEGLLSDLQRAGYRVTPIRRVADDRG
ncbi:hypothetical protein ACFJIX_23805 [Roseateles sp. UC29_93]|uniref:hypothetical protein n=1 Tax=Roseateles sp. UC29_93 TaxID=3350177 RepID=UPI0036721830